MIKVIKENPVPRGKAVCNNCGSELEYGNVDLHEDFGISSSSITAASYKRYYIHCPVCGCDTPASWIPRKEEEK